MQKMAALSTDPPAAHVGAAPCVCLQMFPTNDAAAEEIRFGVSLAERGLVAQTQPARNAGQVAPSNEG